MKQFKNYLIVVVIIVLVILFCASSYTFAKYVYNSAWDYYLQSKGFYFSSDQLAPSLVKNEIKDWDGGSIGFNIKNNKNSTLITEYDINYRVVCSIKEEVSDVKCTLNGTDSNIYTGTLSNYKTCVNKTDDEIDVSSYNKAACEVGGYNWESEIAVQNMYFDVVLTDTNYELTNVTVNITVTSTSPYSKTITGDFLIGKGGIATEGVVNMDYNNYSNYDRLIVTNSYDEEKCVKITWDSDKLLIDVDKSTLNSFFVDSNDYINGITFSIKAKSNLSFIFYPRDFSQIYDVSEFTLEKLGTCD